MSKTEANKKCANVAQEVLNTHAIFKNGLNNLFNSILPNPLTKFALLDMLRDIDTTNKSKSTLRDYCAALVDSHYGIGSEESENFWVNISLIAADDSKMTASYEDNLKALLIKGESLMFSLADLVLASPELTRPLAERFRDTYAAFLGSLGHIASFSNEVENVKQPKLR
jgi:hypothetical protein